MTLTAELLAADLVAAEGHPGGAAHLLLLAVVALVALVVFAVNRVNKRRTSRDAAQREQTDATRELALKQQEPPDEHRERSPKADDAARDEIRDAQGRF